MMTRTNFRNSNQDADLFFQIFGSDEFFDTDPK